MTAHSDLDIFSTPASESSDAASGYRHLARRVIAEAREAGMIRTEIDGWLSGHSPEFSRFLGSRGLIGMTWPTAYGGAGASTLERLAVIEELLAAGAPVAAHWFADRQVGPSLLRHGTPQQRSALLPRMARGELFFCIGMSEPDSGSDLGSVRTRAVRTDDGWSISGAKVWTSHAQHSDMMLALVRTGDPDESPRTALTQVLIPMHAAGVHARPIRMLDGREHFCEVDFDDVRVSDEDVLGTVGAGWGQVLGELSFERSGPERFLSTFPALAELALTDAPEPSPSVANGLGRLVAHLVALRAMSARVAGATTAESAPGIAAAVVKDLGTRLEQDSLPLMEAWLLEQGPQRSALTARLVAESREHAPAFTLRGGVSEVMKDLIARAWSTT